MCVKSILKCMYCVVFDKRILGLYEVKMSTFWSLYVYITKNNNNINNSNNTNNVNNNERFNNNKNW